MVDNSLPDDLDANVTSLRGRHGRLAEKLGADIAAELLQPGDRIVPEELAAAHQVARNVVREAIKILETKGLVSARQRLGTRVLGEEHWDVLDPDVIRWRLAGPSAVRQFNELIVMRGALEPMAARLATSTATVADVRELRSYVAEMEAAVDARDWTALTRADVQFHGKLLALSGSLAFKRLITPIELVITMRQEMSLMPEHLDHKTIQEHMDIIESIVAGDEKGAALASARLVDSAGSETIEAFLLQRGEST